MIEKLLDQLYLLAGVHTKGAKPHADNTLELECKKWFKTYSMHLFENYILAIRKLKNYNKWSP